MVKKLGTQGTYCFAISWTLLNHAGKLTAIMNKLLTLIFVLSISHACAAAECVALPKDAESFIKAFNARARGAEDCEARTVIRGDVDADGVEDLIVAFNIEGACGKDKTVEAGSCGNHDETYLKIFLGRSTKEIPLLMIASRGERQIAGLSFVAGAIHAETLKYGKNDAMCCPSIKGKTRFVLGRDVIAERRL